MDPPPTRVHTHTHAHVPPQESGKALPDRFTVVVSRTLESLPDADIARWVCMCVCVFVPVRCIGHACLCQPPAVL
jgi:hypothetical protein